MFQSNGSRRIINTSVSAAAGLIYITAVILLSSNLDMADGFSATLVSLFFILFAALALCGLLSLTKGSCKTCGVIFFSISCALLIARLAVFDYQTLDYQNFLAPWTQFFRDNGGLAALGREIGNYNVPYLVFLSLCSYVPVSELYLIKILSVLFDLLLAYSLGRIVLKLTHSPIKAGICFVVGLILPTVYLNGALWGQCDSIYCSLAIFAVALAFEDKPVASLAAAALSFAFKLQAVFILPFFVILLIVGRVKWYHLPAFPAVYLAAVSPALIAGRPFFSTVFCYFSDASTIGSGLNYNSPSIFAIFTDPSSEALAGYLGIAAAFLCCAAVFIAFLILRRKADSFLILISTVILAVAIPLFLPHMHERYFILADTLTLALAFCIPGTFACVPLASFASLLGYHAYLRQRYLLPMKWGAYALLLVLVLLCLFFVQNIKENKNKFLQLP